MLAARGNVLVTGDVGDWQPRGDGGAQAGKGDVLCGLEAATFKPFELNTDGMVVAVVSPAPLGCAGVPSPGSHVDKLHQLAVAPNEEMGGYRQTPNLLEVGVRVPIKLVGKQLFDFRATKLAWWQTDGVDDDQVDPGAFWPRAKVG